MGLVVGVGISVGMAVGISVWDGSRDQCMGWV